MCRLDFIWKHKLWEEKEEAQTMGLVNRMLLTNILPEHIANHYLTDEVKSDELYCEEYEQVAVMFASIPEFSLFYSETDINEEGRRCLQLLNEILCDFDEVNLLVYGLILIIFYLNWYIFFFSYFIFLLSQKSRKLKLSEVHTWLLLVYTLDEVLVR